MVEMQKFNLCWNEFDKAASATMKNLVADQDFTDVTISCDDDETILAHKIVLGSSSPVFRYFYITYQNLNNPWSLALSQSNQEPVACL